MDEFVRDGVLSVGEERRGGERWGRGAAETLVRATEELVFMGGSSSCFIDALLGGRLLLLLLHSGSGRGGGGGGALSWEGLVWFCFGFGFTSRPR